MPLLTKKVCAAFLMLGIGILPIFIAYHVLATIGEEQLSTINSDYNVIIIKSFIGYAPGALVGGIAIVIATIGLVFSAIKPVWYTLFLKASTILCLFGVALMFSGPITISLYWGYDLRDKGYVRCDDYPLLGRDRIHISAWAKDPAVCENRQAAKLLYGTSKEDMERVHNYLEGKPYR